jgi:predicted small lipoprotein YifL
MVTALARSCLLAMGVVFVAGCGQKGPLLVPVSGLVTLDGEPLASAIVAFEQHGRG